MLKTAYEMRISDWSSDVCSSDLFTQCAADPARGAWLRCRGWGAVGSAVRIAQPPHSERGGYCQRIRHAPAGGNDQACRRGAEGRCGAAEAVSGAPTWASRVDWTSVV